MKTPITVLHEMMMKLGEVPEYECIAQSGPNHQMTFEYQCKVHGREATAVARSKKDAKQEAARLLLLQLAQTGMPVPAPFGTDTTAGQCKASTSTASMENLPRQCPAKNPLENEHQDQKSPLKRVMDQPLTTENITKRERIETPEYKTIPQSNQKQNKHDLAAKSSEAGGSGATPTVDSNSYVALIKELSQEYRLPAVDYDLVGDTGPPHMRQFTVRASIGQHSRLATAATKRGARQAAAETLYHYLRDNLRITKDFVEEAALVRAHERAMERYHEVRADDSRPRLEQRPAHYHLGLTEQFDEEKRGEALPALAEEPPEVALSCAVSVLGLTETWTQLPRRNQTPLEMVSLEPTAPSLVFGGDSRAGAAAAAVRYMRAAMLLPAHRTPDTA